MEHGKIENHIENKLSNYESPVDAEGLWNSLGIEDTPTTHFSPGNKYRIYLLLVPIILGSALYLFTSSNGSNDGSENTISKESAIRQISIESQTVNQKIESKEVDSENPLVEGIELDFASNSSSSDLERLKENVQTKELNTPNRIDSKTNITTQSFNGSDSKKINAIFKNSNTAVNRNSNSIDGSNHSKTQVLASYDATNSEIQQSTVSKSSTLISDNKRELLLDGSLSNLDVPSMNSIGLMNFPRPVRCPDFGGRKPLRFNLDIHAIPYYSNQLLSLIDESELNKTWLEQRNSTEKPLEAFQVNVLGRLQTNSGLYVQGGIGYGQIDQKLSVPIQETTSTSNEQGPVIVIIYGNGIPNDTIIGEVPVTTIERKGAETYNYHRMIEIPIALGYERRMNDWGFYIDGGASLNIWTSRKGYMLKDNKPQKYEDVGVFTTSTGIKLNGSLGMKYYFNNDMSLSAGPDIRYHMQNWMKPQFGMTQKHLDIGLRVGLSIPLM